MQEEVPGRKKAMTLVEVDSAVRYNVPVDDRHPFFVDFSDVRGEFEDRVIYKALKVDPNTFHYNSEVNIGNKAVLFLAGMKGSGKTTELAKIAHKLNHSECFFCVTCNLDEGLDVNDMEYMDVLIFQINRLLEDLKDRKVSVDDSVVASMQKWFEERVKEVNSSIKREGGIQLEAKAGLPGIISFFAISSTVRAALTGTKERAEKIRSTFKNNFSAFVLVANTFFESINLELRRRKIAKEILFVVDGLEKVGTKDIRRRLIEDELNRILQIKVNTIFTLPLELIALKEKLNQSCKYASFPFVKIKDANNVLIEKARDRFREFVLKRIDITLFDNMDTIDLAIEFGGGSPRNLLRILNYAYYWSDDALGKITRTSVEKALKKLAAETSQYISTADLSRLKLLKENNQQGIPTNLDKEWLDMLENVFVMEYNDGSFLRVNPVIEISERYKHYVG